MWMAGLGVRAWAGLGNSGGEAIAGGVVMPTTADGIIPSWSLRVQGRVLGGNGWFRDA